MAAIKILSVDDEMDLELVLTQYFRRKIRKEEYQFTFAHNGVEALKVLLEDPHYDIILSDINMPEMDGLTLLTKVNEMRNPALKCIMVSAYGDLGNIRSAMNNGAFDFATKPIDMEDLERTIEKAIEQINFVKSAQHTEHKLADIQSDLNLAREIQMAILPKVFPAFPLLKSFDIFASMNAAKSVGGDFYDFFLLPDNKLGFVMADVSDKGVPAAIFMAVSRTVVRTVALRAASAAECLEESNNIICGENPANLFVTTFYGILDYGTGEVTYCNGGHNHPVLITSAGETSFLKGAGNLVLGAMDGMKYTNLRLKLSPGDRLYLYTDGVTEGMDSDYNQYSDARLLETCKGLSQASAREMVETVTASLTEFVNGAPQSDDITMMAITYNG